MIDGRLKVKWISTLPMSNDHQLYCCGKHKGLCTRCVCVLNQLPCTIFCQCPVDCPNRKLTQTITCNSQTIMKSTTEKTDFFSRNSRFTSALFDPEYSSEEDDNDESSMSTENGICGEMNEAIDSISSSSQSESEECGFF